jgi:hypothetical protein
MTRWEFFKTRYRENLEAPPKVSPQKRAAKARTGLLILGAIAVVEVIAAAAGAGWYVWVIAGSMALLAAYNFSQLQEARRELTAVQTPLAPDESPKQ